MRAIGYLLNILRDILASGHIDYSGGVNSILHYCVALVEPEQVIVHMICVSAAPCITLVE